MGGNIIFPLIFYYLSEFDTFGCLYADIQHLRCRKNVVIKIRRRIFNFS